MYPTVQGFAANINDQMSVYHCFHYTYKINRGILKGYSITVPDSVVMNVFHLFLCKFHWLPDHSVLRVYHRVDRLYK